MSRVIDHSFNLHYLEGTPHIHLHYSVTRESRNHGCGHVEICCHGCGCAADVCYALPQSLKAAVVCVAQAALSRYKDDFQEQHRKCHRLVDLDDPDAACPSARAVVTHVDLR